VDDINAEIRKIGVDKLAASILDENTGMLTVVVRSEDGKDEFEYDVVPSDSYPKINQVEADALKAIYGDIIAVEESVSVDTKLFEKYSEYIQDFIKSCETIPAEEKEKFFTKNSKPSILKGTVNRIHELAIATSDSVTNVIANIKPVIKIQDVKRTKKGV
jgi:hypothetical protein